MGEDIVGEAWGKSKERVEIPINNYKDIAFTFETWKPISEKNAII
jgi:hypothetical protein